MFLFTLICQCLGFPFSTAVNINNFNKLQILREGTEEKNQAMVGAIPYCGEYPGPGFGDKFRSAKQIDGISKAGGDKMADG